MNTKRELEKRGDEIAAAIKRNQDNARRALQDRAFPGRVLAVLDKVTEE